MCASRYPLHWRKEHSLLLPPSLLLSVPSFISSFVYPSCLSLKCWHLSFLTGPFGNIIKIKDYADSRMTPRTTRLGPESLAPHFQSAVDISTWSSCWKLNPDVLQIITLCVFFNLQIFHRLLSPVSVESIYLSCQFSASASSLLPHPSHQSHKISNSEENFAFIPYFSSVLSLF